MKVTVLDEKAIQDIGHAFGYYAYGAEHGMVEAFPSRDAVAALCAAVCGRKGGKTYGIVFGESKALCGTASLCAYERGRRGFPLYPER